MTATVIRTTTTTCRGRPALSGPEPSENLLSLQNQQHQLVESYFNSPDCSRKTRTRTMSPYSVLLFLLQLYLLQMLLVSMPTCKLPGNLVLNTHNLLRDLGEKLPTHCQQPNNKIQFPDGVISAAHPQCRWTSLVVYEWLREAGIIFSEYDLPEGEGGVTWSQQKLDVYLNLQDRLVEDHQCLNSTEASPVLLPYFRNITAVVNQQDGSACGWEILRSDLLRVLRLALHKHRQCFNWTKAH